MLVITIPIGSDLHLSTRVFLARLIPPSFNMLIEYAVTVRVIISVCELMRTDCSLHVKVQHIDHHGSIAAIGAPPHVTSSLGEGLS